MLKKIDVSIRILWLFEKSSKQNQIKKRKNYKRNQENPLLSEKYEDYHAICAFAYILERYLCKEQLSEKIYCLSQRNLELLKRNEKIFDEIVKNSYKNW